MMRKKIIFLICIAAVTALFTGCSGSAQYGNYVLKETINPDTDKVSQFPYPITVTIEKNGNIYLQGDLFGVVEENKQTYYFTQTVQVGDIEEMIEQEGMWQLERQNDGTTALLIYPYDEKIVYKLYKLSDND